MKLLECAHGAFSAPQSTGWKLILGSWDPKNDSIIRRICSEKYARVMRRIMVSETISYSQDIVFEHTYMITQDSRGRQM